MNYIVLDMEFTVMKGRKYLTEIVEIGAVKLCHDADGLAMIDLFHTHVKPTERPCITPMTTAFTGITQHQIDAAPLYPAAIGTFIEWLGNEPYYLIAWGPDDKQMLVQQCNKHDLPLDWILNYNDIQLPFTYEQGGNNGGRWGLAKALAAQQLPFFGTHHNALDDAFNTAKLFKSMFPKLTLQHNNAAHESVAEAKLVYSTGREINNPFSKLAELELNTAM